MMRRVNDRPDLGRAPEDLLACAGPNCAGAKRLAIPQYALPGGRSGMALARRAFDTNAKTRGH